MRYKIVTESGQQVIYTYLDDGVTVFNKEGYSDEQMFDIRKKQSMFATKYIKNLTSPTQFNNVRGDLRNAMIDYEAVSDLVISWLKGENSAVYGNFTTNGFPTKSYFTAQRQIDLLAILSLT